MSPERSREDYVHRVSSFCVVDTFYRAMTSSSVVSDTDIEPDLDTIFCALNWKYGRLIEIHHPSSLGQLFINRNILYLSCVSPELGFMLKQDLPEYEGGKEKAQKSLQNLYAVQDGLGAYLCQPTLTGRFLISSHCHPAHLRRLLSR